MQGEGEKERRREGEKEEGEVGKWGSREVGKWGSGEVGKWGSGEVGKWGSGEERTSNIPKEAPLYFVCNSSSGPMSSIIPLLFTIMVPLTQQSVTNTELTLSLLPPRPLNCPATYIFDDVHMIHLLATLVQLLVGFHQY